MRAAPRITMKPRQVIKTSLLAAFTVGYQTIITLRSLEGHLNSLQIKMIRHHLQSTRQLNQPNEAQSSSSNHSSNRSQTYKNLKSKSRPLTRYPCHRRCSRLSLGWLLMQLRRGAEKTMVTWDSATQRSHWLIVKPIQTMSGRTIIPVLWKSRSHLVLHLPPNNWITTTGRYWLRRAWRLTSCERCSCEFMRSTQLVQMMMNRPLITLAISSRWPIFMAKRGMCIRVLHLTMRTHWNGTTRKNCSPCRLILALSSSRTPQKSK